jgi:hypothetical protein
LLSYKLDSTINFVAIILVGKILYLIAGATTIHEIIYNYIPLSTMDYNYHIVAVRTVKYWEKFLYMLSCAHHWVSVC